MKKYVLIFIPIILFVIFDAVLITDFIKSKEVIPTPDVQGISTTEDEEYILTVIREKEHTPTKITPSAVMVEIVDKRSIKIISSEEPTPTPTITITPTPSLTPTPIRMYTQED